MKTFDGRNCLLGNNFELAVYRKEEGENDKGKKKFEKCGKIQKKGHAV